MKTLREGNLLAIRGLATKSDIRFEVIQYVSRDDSYRLRTVGARHSFLAEAIPLHARIRAGDLIVEKGKVPNV